jgi:PAS domain S-box-containing protein
MQKIRSGERLAHYETVRQKKDGTRVDVSLSVSPIRDETGRIIGAAAIARDISDRNKRHKDDLRESEEALEERTRMLQSREELLKIFVKNVPAGVAMFDRDMRYLQVSDRWCADYSVDSSQVLGRSHYDIFPDMPKGWREVHRRGLEGETSRADEERWDRKDGTTLWVHWEARPWRTSNGIIGGLLILAEDITHHKQMQDALSTLSRRLIEAQEQERARIGRELHDDINQRLSILALELEQLQDNPAEVGSRLQELRNQTMEISDDVQALSHELHSSKLEYLGVVAGIKSWCSEFGERQRMQLEFKSDVVSVLPLDVGVCLLRVLQEALHNAVKYSGTKRVEVQLEEHSNEVHLIVHDSGKGFDIELARQGRGLGLTSMQERVKLVSGTISIESKPMGGTTIHVRMPVGLGHESQRAAG